MVIFHSYVNVYQKVHGGCSVQNDLSVKRTQWRKRCSELAVTVNSGNWMQKQSQRISMVNVYITMERSIIFNG